MPTVERLLVSYSDHVTGRALYQPTASTAPTPAEPPERTFCCCYCCARLRIPATHCSAQRVVARVRANRHR